MGVSSRIALCATVLPLLAGAHEATADEQHEVAHVIVEGLLLGPSKKGGTRWDGGGSISRGDRARFAAATKKLSAATGNVYAMAATELADVVGGMITANSDMPDPRGTATVYVNGRMLSKPIHLATVSDTFTPQWPGKLDWELALDQDVRIQITLADGDPSPLADDPMGSVVINSRDLRRAADDGHSYANYVGDQSSEQIVYVRVSVMPEGTDALAQEPASEETLTTRFLAFLQRALDIMVTNTKDCDAMAAELTQLRAENADLLATVHERWRTRAPAAVVEFVATKQDAMKQALQPCSNNGNVAKAVKVLFTP